MTEFVKQFGSGQMLKPQETFGCPQAICDISSRFVTKNPMQICKRVHSKTPSIGPALQACVGKRKSDTQDAVSKYLGVLAQGLVDGTISGEQDRKIKVCVLGRYNKHADFIPGNWREKFGRYAG
ncbi:hypothetical protein [Pseudomonas huanghezhanensis]|uniref:hypothetical protein n=1 Tax=Pseudomonas huanghezhanensis TaxID=3002903 RepID=UPI0022861580|nr:hypothetical protein [Pseudomonas sp. BSw22131]